MKLLVNPGQPLGGSASELQQEAADRLLAMSTNPPSSPWGWSLPLEDAPPSQRGRAVPGPLDPALVPAAFPTQSALESSLHSSTAPQTPTGQRRGRETRSLESAPLAGARRTETGRADPMNPQWCGPCLSRGIRTKVAVQAMQTPLESPHAELLPQNRAGGCTC